MPQQPKLRKKKVGNFEYWFTKAGGDTYLGNVEEVPYTEAKKLFSAHLQSLSINKESSKGARFTAGELMDLFLDWVQSNRSKQTYISRRIYCSRFAAFKVGSNLVADLPAQKIKSSDLESFLKHLKKENNLSPQSLLHAETSVRHAWNWATKYPSPTSYLPSTYRPFSAVERTRVPFKVLTENALITPSEIDALFSCAEIDLDQFRRFGMARTIERVGHENLRRSGNFSEVLKCYYHTGARTDELASCEVGDLLPETRQIVLGKHKRSRTQRISTIRHIALNDEALEIFKRNCAGRNEKENVFIRRNGAPWTRRNIAKRFDRVKDFARLINRAIRPEITVYDFRHLWISEALMAGNDIATVATMAGTSVAMIERVYGHFRNDHLHEAQGRLDQARKRRKR